MNLGLILSKPGESDLGLACRLWMANQYSWYLDNIHIGDRIEEEIYSQPFLASIECGLTGLQRIRAIEALHLPNIPRPNLPSFLRKTENRRNCPSCAQSGYHSCYFDLPWIHECPVHLEPLVDHCPKCLSSWPRAQDVHLRRCKLCGIRDKSMLSKPNLSRTKKVFDNSGYDLISELDIFFNESLVFARPHWREHFHLFTARSSRYSKTKLYPSILASHYYSDYEDWQKSLPISDTLVPCVKIKFKRDTKRRKYWSSYIGDTTRVKLSTIRKKVFKQAAEELLELAGHPLGACQGTNDSNSHKQCYYCEVNDQLSSAFYHQVDRRGQFADYSVLELGKVKYGDPGLISYVTDSSNSSNPENCPELAVPRTVQYQVYELDIISCVKQLAFQVLLSRHHKDRNHFQINAYSSQEVLVNSYGYSNHYFFVVNPGDVVLYYPEEYQRFSFDSLDHWLSMTCSY